MRLKIEVELSMSDDEFRLVDTALNRQLKGDDVAKARALSEKWKAAREAVLAKLTEAGVPLHGVLAGGAEPPAN